MVFAAATICDSADRAGPRQPRVIAQAAALQLDADIQALLRRNFEAFLEHINAGLTEKRRERPLKGSLHSMIGKDHRQDWALSAAIKTEEFESLIASLREYWDDQDLHEAAI